MEVRVECVVNLIIGKVFVDQVNSHPTHTSQTTRRNFGQVLKAETDTKLKK